MKAKPKKPRMSEAYETIEDIVREMRALAARESGTFMCTLPIDEMRALANRADVAYKRELSGLKIARDFYKRSFEKEEKRALSLQFEVKRLKKELAKCREANNGK